MKLLRKNKAEKEMRWLVLNEIDQLNSIKEASFSKPVAIFKHSTRCSISAMAKDRLERGWDIESEALDIYYLDLLAYRPISNEISSVFGVQHESPQILLVKDGEVVYHASHGGIGVSELKQYL